MSSMLDRVMDRLLNLNFGSNLIRMVTYCSESRSLEILKEFYRRKRVEFHEKSPFSVHADASQPPVSATSAGPAYFSRLSDG